MITEQRAIDLQKISDLKEIVGSTSRVSKWRVDGELFTYSKGDSVLRAGREYWELDQATKAAAKKKLYQLFK